MSGKRIFVSRVSFQNFRGFAEGLEFDPNPHLQVVAGVNGSGKSSVLDGVSFLVAAIPMVLAGLNRGFGLTTSDIGSSAQEVVNSLELSDGENVEAWAQRAYFDDENKPLHPEKSVDEFSFLSKLATTKADRSSVLPVVEYLHSGSTRMPVDHDYPDEFKQSRLAAYRGCFDSEAHQFQQLESWFEEEENLENEQRIRKRNLNLTIPSLRAVRGAVETFLSHLHQSRLANLKVVRFHAKGPLEPASGKLAMDKDGHQLMLTQLSDGERRLVLMVADIARRMAILNPALADPLESPGIILVDEIELHLHPLWQRTVVPALQAAFPNVQLLLTTHSPQVLASVPDECVVILKDGQAMPGHPRVHGRDTNTILEQVMGATARPPEVQARIDEIYTLIERHPDDARARLEALEAELGDDEPDLVRARAMMDFVGA